MQHSAQWDRSEAAVFAPARTLPNQRLAMPTMCVIASCLTPRRQIEVAPQRRRRECLQVEVSPDSNVPSLRDQPDTGPGDLGQTFAACADVFEDLPAHAGIPVAAQMVRDVLRRLPGILSGKERGYLVDHVYQMVWVHWRQSRKRCGFEYTT